MARKQIEASLGWLTLPERMTELVPGLEKLAAAIRTEADRVVVVGAGGAALAPWALAGILGPPRDSRLSTCSTRPSHRRWRRRSAASIPRHAVRRLVEVRRDPRDEPPLRRPASTRRRRRSAKPGGPALRRRHGARLGSRDRGGEASRPRRHPGGSADAGRFRRALAVRSGPGGSGRAHDPGRARPRRPHGRGVPRSGHRESGPPARGRARSRGARRARQADALGGAGGSRVRPAGSRPSWGRRRARTARASCRSRASRSGLPTCTARTASSCASSWPALRTRRRIIGWRRSWSTGIPCLGFVLRDALDLGAEIFRWEFATAVAGRLLGVNPFDESDQADVRNRASRILAGGSLEPAAAAASADGGFARLLASIQPGDYFAISAYLPETPDGRRGARGPAAARSAARSGWRRRSVSARECSTRPDSSTREARPAARLCS